MIFVEKYPKMKQYSDETKFNMYRSLICLYLAIYSLDNIIDNIDNIINPINIKNVK